MERFILKGITQPGADELADGLFSLGRNPTTDIRVHDPTVSSFHCEVIVSGTTVLVRDLNSTNGTFVDGDQIQEAFLRPWQILRLGKAELRLEVEEVGNLPVVSIPSLPTPKGEGDTHLLDGRLACGNHPGVPAVLRCTQCHRAFCADCVKPIGLRGAQKRLFCPACSNPCEPVTPRAQPRKTSFIGRLTETIRIKLRG